MDPVERLTHDHHHLNRMVASLREAMQDVARGERDAVLLRDDVAEFLDLAQDELFEHFEVEETQLFPFVVERLPALGDTVEHLSVAHDRMCGAISRLERTVRLDDAAFTEQIDQVIALIARFDANYVKHSHDEYELIKVLAEKLDDDDRATVARLLDEI